MSGVFSFMIDGHNSYMENPWLNLPDEAPFILDVDRESIGRCSKSRHKDRTKLNVGSIPEPFIGNPVSAKLVLLNLNPGDSEGDRMAHNDPEFRGAMIRNLRHELQEFPFYPLNPAFRWTACAKWWVPRTRELQLATGLDDATFAERLLVIEWFPYHSKKSGLPRKVVCESQKYSFQLVLEMLARKKLVVRMRSKRHWTIVSPDFGKLDSLRNPQCGYISRGNTDGDLFDRIIEALQ